MNNSDLSQASTANGATIPTPMNSKVLYEINNGVARITLNRPEKRNALDGEVVAELKQAISASAGDPSCRVVLLTGAGTDFCSGADLAALEKTAQSDVLDNMAEARHTADLFLMMRNHPRPIVAAVQGRALAGGCGLATACDIILAAESAQFGYPEVNIGFVPAMVMAILRRSFSEKAAFEFVASGQPVSAARACELGLIHRVVPDEKFQSETEAYVASLAKKPASALTLIKRLLYNMDSMSFEAALEAGVEVNAIARMTEDCRAGVARFLKKPKG
jgi:methylglutaconyl-CoA hydratase